MAPQGREWAQPTRGCAPAPLPRVFGAAARVWGMGAAGCPPEPIKAAPQPLSHSSLVGGLTPGTPKMALYTDLIANLLMYIYVF